MPERKTYTIHDVIAAQYALEPLVCIHCGSDEVTYHQGVTDAYCAKCGRWQLDNEIPLVKNGKIGKTCSGCNVYFHGHFGYGWNSKKQVYYLCKGCTHKRLDSLAKKGE